MDDNIINDRAQSLLKTLVERYIEDGQPVGSATLARDSAINLSPATIRNVMSDLEELGLIHSPHTSAGRIPTAADAPAQPVSPGMAKGTCSATVTSGFQSGAAEEETGGLIIANFQIQ